MFNVYEDSYINGINIVLRLVHIYYCVLLFYSKYERKTKIQYINRVRI